jgi:hypothetical protein
MLVFNCVVSDAGVNVLTVNANAHDTFPLAKARTQGFQKHLDSNNLGPSCCHPSGNLEGSAQFLGTIILTNDSSESQGERKD